MKERFLKLSKDRAEKDLDLSLLEMVILAQVEEFNSNGCDCYLTNEQFAKFCHVSYSSVDRALTKLEDNKYIKRITTVVNGFGKTSRQRKIILIDKKETHKKETTKQNKINDVYSF